MVMCFESPIMLLTNTAVINGKLGQKRDVL